MNDIEDISFGLSSFLFIIPFLYSYYILDSFIVWKIVLLLLIISSYLCNHYPTIRIYQLYDHTIIILVAITYAWYVKNMYIIVALCILYSIELVKTNCVQYTVMIGFIILNLCAWTYLTINECYVIIIIFFIAIYCKVSRNYKSYTYSYYTSIWHLCCVLLLLFATKTFVL